LTGSRIAYGDCYDRNDNPEKSLFLTLCVAVINVSGGGTNTVFIVGAIIAIIGIIYFIRKNPNFLKNLFGGGGKIGAAVEGTARLTHRMMCRKGL
jgi:hypothetical protein